MSGDGESAPKASAGWYPDPSQPDTVRYWDGETWTDQRGPAALPNPAPGEGGFDSRRLLFVGGALVAVAIVVVVVLLSDSGGSGGGAEAGETAKVAIPSGSMEPTFKIDEEVTIDVDAYADSEPAIGDVVVLRPPRGAESASECGILLNGMQTVEMGEACPKPTAAVARQVFVKRVVAVGGDTLSIKEGQAVVNGEEMNERAFTNPCGGGYECNLPRTIRIPPGYFFLLGDNRGESDDSRYWGPVPAALIIGRVEG